MSEKNKCDCCGWDDNGYQHEPFCSSLTPTPTIEEMVEKFAAMEHNRWSRWQSHVHNKCTKNEDGSLTIPASLVTHWEYQISTPYSQLTEVDKQKDRDQVRPYTEALTTIDQNAREEEREAWMKGERCFMCGTEMLNPDGLSNTCARCFEEA